MNIGAAATLRLPLICAPMIIVSRIELLLACCRAGVVGAFQAGNPRTLEEFASWISTIEAAQTQAADEGTAFAPYIINFIVAASRDNDLTRAKLDLCAKVRVPLILTTAGHPGEMVKRVHDWGGLVIHDVTTMRFAEKAIEAGVDGLLVVCGGAGGHAGTLNPFAFVPELRKIYAGPLVLAGAITNGRGIAAALTLGADMVCMGTRFIATRESGAVEGHKQMLVEASADDIIYTDSIAGMAGNFLRQSILANGLDPKNLPPPRGLHRPNLPEGVKPWKTVWSAGQSAGAIEDIPSVAELVERLAQEFEASQVTTDWRARLSASLAPVF